MKLSKLILPVALLFSLTGCNGTEPTAEGGNVPEGGKETLPSRWTVAAGRYGVGVDGPGIRVWFRYRSR